MSDPIQKIKVRNLLRFDQLAQWNISNKSILVGEPIISHDLNKNRLMLVIGRDTNVQGTYNYDSQNNYNTLTSNEQYTFFSGKGAGYELPIASSSGLGGIRIKPQIGSGENTTYSCIEIENSAEDEGVISVNKENLANYFIATSSLKNQVGGDSIQHIATNLVLGDPELCNGFYNTSSTHSTLGIGGQLVVCTNPLTSESIINKNAGRNIIQGDLYVDGTITSLIHTEQDIIEDDYIILRSGNNNPLANNTFSGIKILNGSVEHENLGIVMDNRGFLFTTKESNNQTLYRHTWMCNNTQPVDLGSGINIQNTNYTEIAYIASNNNDPMIFNDLTFNRFGGDIQLVFNAIPTSENPIIDICYDTVGNMYIGVEQDLDDNSQSYLIVHIGSFEQSFPIPTEELTDINNPIELYISRLNDSTIEYIYINYAIVFKNENNTGDIGILTNSNNNFLKFFGNGMSYIRYARVYCNGDKALIPCRLYTDHNSFGFYENNSNTYYDKGEEDFIRGYDKIGSYNGTASKFLKYNNDVFAEPTIIRYTDISGNIPSAALPSISIDKIPNIPLNKIPEIPFSKLETSDKMLNIEYGRPNITISSLDWPTSQTTIPILTIPRSLNDLDDVDDSNYIISNTQNYKINNSITKIEISSNVQTITYENRNDPNSTSINDKIAILPIFKINGKELTSDIDITIDDILTDFTEPEVSVSMQYLGCLQENEQIKTISDLVVDEYGRVKSYTKNLYFGSSGIVCYMLNEESYLKMNNTKISDTLVISFSNAVSTLEYTYTDLNPNITLTPKEQRVAGGLLYNIQFELPANVSYGSLVTDICTVTIKGIDSYGRESNSVSIPIRK